MKIALVGKGGSGKTTISALLARTLGVRGLPVIAIDADINQHLATTLGFSPAEAVTIPPLGIEIAKIKEYVMGNNPRIESAASMIKTTPPGKGSRLLSFKQNPLYDYFARTVEGVRMMAVGPFTEEDLGIKCYHSKTGAVELFLNHLVDGKGEYAIVDMTAGSDSFASGLFTRFDISFLVVEPTVKSVSVYEQYKQYAKDHDVSIKVIGNKVATKEDVEFLREKVGADLVAYLSTSSFVQTTDRGQHVELAELEPENAAAIEAVIDAIDAQKKDWKKFYAQAIEFHIKNARSWANAEAGLDLTAQVDPDFDLVGAVSA